MMQININKNVIKNIFILEDNEFRIEWFKKTLGNDFNLTFSDKVNETKYLLNHNKYDILFLDHDLDGKQWVEITDENTGSRVAEEIKKLNLNVPIVIHSWNSIGVRNMTNILSPIKCICARFSEFLIKIIDE